MQHFVQVGVIPQQSSTIITLLVSSTVGNRVRPSEPVVNTRRPFCSQHLWYDARVEKEAGDLVYTVAILLCYKVLLLFLLA